MCAMPTHSVVAGALNGANGRDQPPKNSVVISAAEMAEIAAALPKGLAVGDRYPASMMTFINR